MKRRIILILAAILLAAGLQADPPDWQVIPGTQYSMVIFASATIDDVEFIGTGQNMIAAFGPAGETDCRAVATWNENGFWYFTIVANEQSESISFLLYNAANDEILECSQTVTFQNNAVIGSPGDPFQITSGSSSGTISGNINLFNTYTTAIEPGSVTVYANNFSTNPDANGNFSFELPAGDYQINASLENYTSNTITDIQLENGQTIENISLSLIDWQVITGTQYSLSVMADLEMDDNLIGDNPNNFLAAFGPGGYADCRAIASWEPANPPYWEGYWFMTVVGNINGEQIDFIYFEAEDNVCAETISFSDNAVYGDPTNPYNLTAGIVEQNIDLSNNWNWISFQVAPQDNALSSVMSMIADNAYQIKNQHRSATYYPEMASWIGDLEQVIPGEAYLLKMLAPAQLNISGERIDPSSPISLNSYWNWVAYYPTQTMAVENALSSVLDNLLQVKNQNQTAFYYNPPGSWVGDLETMQPGIGYKIKLSGADQLIYDPSRVNNDIAKIEPKISREVPDWEVVSGTQYSMVLMLKVNLEDQPFENDGNNLVGIFGPGGESDCRGLGVWQEVEELDDFWYITIVGNENDEELSIKIYDEATDAIYENCDVIIFEDNATVGSVQNPYITGFYMSSAEEENLLPAQFKIYPNPFQPTNTRIGATISFDRKSTAAGSTVNIYNLKGQKIVTRELSEADIARGNISWSGYNQQQKVVSSGLYFISLQNEQQVMETEKFMIIK
jgi:hypothetical protein